MARSSFLENNNPVDFLYLDRQRISSLLGQLSDQGVLTQFKSVASKTTNTEGQAEGSIKVLKVEGKRSQTFAESAEHTYDPFWTHAYGFLRDLEENFAVPLEDGHFGSLVKFNALVQFVDLKLMHNLWEPSAQAFLSQIQASQQPTEQTAQAMNIGLQLLKEVPHRLHLTFLTASGFRLWAAAQPENLTISTEDLTMKFGATLDGLWTVVGIVDGRIGPSPDPLPVNELVDGAISAMALLRRFLGRPETHWGLTPIAIYSSIRGVAETEAMEEANPIK